jgi:hypothetical protein
MKCVIAFFLLCVCAAGCSPFEYAKSGKQASVHSFRLADREIKILGLDPVAGRMVTKSTYDTEAVYSVLSRVRDLKLRKPGSSGLSGGVEFEMIIQKTVDGSPYSSGDLIKISGYLDGTTAWVKKGSTVEVVFANDTHNFVDLRQAGGCENEAHDEK